MTSPSDEKRICAMFDSFCKKVSRNYLRDLERAEERRDSHYSDEPVARSLTGCPAHTIPMLWRTG